MVERNAFESLDDDGQAEIQIIDKNNFKHLLSGNSPVSKDAFIVIELQEPGRNFKAGDKISGAVKVLVNKKFDASAVALRLYGVDKASFTPAADGKIAKEDLQPVRISETILDVNFKIFKFADNESAFGHLLFPFTITLPDWLPESVMLKDGSTTLAVIYFLTAQLDPRSDELYADKKTSLSLCRDERMIYIYRDTEAAD